MSVPVSRHGNAIGAFTRTQCGLLRLREFRTVYGIVPVIAGQRTGFAADSLRSFPPRIYATSISQALRRGRSAPRARRCCSAECGLPARMIQPAVMGAGRGDPHAVAGNPGVHGARRRARDGDVSIGKMKDVTGSSFSSPASASPLRFIPPNPGYPMP